jgi:hypothetical protein
MQPLPRFKPIRFAVVPQAPERRVQSVQNVFLFGAAHYVCIVDVRQNGSNREQLPAEPRVLVPLLLEIRLQALHPVLQTGVGEPQLGVFVLEIKCSFCSHYDVEMGDRKRVRAHAALLAFPLSS